MVRFANNDDLAFVKNSWSICFGDPQEFVDWNFKYNYLPENTVIAEADGVPVSVMQLMPYRLNICGKTVNARYVSGVATLPEYRGRGMVRKLFEFGLPVLKDLDCDISILIPAVSGLYEKFGYEKLCERVLYKADRLCGGEIITGYDKTLAGLLKPIYKDAVSQKQAYVERSDADWERILQELLSVSGGAAVINGGEPRGYALAYPKDGGYEVWEKFGEIDLPCEPIEAPPVLARLVKRDKIAELHTLEANEAYINMLL